MSEAVEPIERTYIIHVRVAVLDDKPDQPENEENVVYSALGQAKAALADNRADWWATEEVF